jgi:multidrug efflux pump subunit AcrA (membrane-fusion protein)
LIEFSGACRGLGGYAENHVDLQKGVAMRCTVVALICFALASLLPIAGRAEENDTVTVPNCVLGLSQETQVPAQEAGVLTAAPVREGQEVAAGDVLVQIEDSAARAQYEIAASEL